MHYSQYDDKNDNCFYQLGDLYRLMTEDKRELLIGNTVRHMGDITENIKYRHAAHCYLADREYGERMAKALNINLDHVIELSQMSREERFKVTMPKQ